MRNPMDVPYRFMLFCAGLLLLGCAGPPRSYPAGDMPMSGPLPSRKPPLWTRPGKESSGLSKGQREWTPCFPQVK